MNFSLLLTDLAARLFGLLALVTLGVYVSARAGYYGDAKPFTVFDAIFACFVLFKVFEFIVSTRFETKMFNTERILERISYLISTLFFILSCGILLWRSGIAEIEAMGDLSKSWGIIAIAVAMAIYVIIFVSGVAFRAYASYSNDIMIGMRPHPNAERLAEARQRDWLDHVISWLLLVPLGLPVLSYIFLAGTVATPAYYRWEEEHSQLFIAAVVGSTLIVGFLAMLRSPVRVANRRPATRGAQFLGMLFFTGLSVGSWSLIGAKTFVPTVYNLVAGSPEGSRVYKVTDLGRQRHVGLCLDLQPTDDSGIDLKACRMPSSLNSPELIGSEIEFTGELSEYGHTLANYRIIR